MTRRRSTVAEHEGWVTLPTGVRIRYRRAGEGDGGVYLLHGIAHSLHAWDRVIVPLAEHHDVIAVDLPGCGASDKPDTDYSLGSQATAIRYVLEFLGLDMVTAIGHSLGGGVAMTLAYQYPERVGRLGLIASGGLGRELHAMFRLASLPLGPDKVMRLAFSPRTRPLRRLLATLCGAPLFARPDEHREDTIDILRTLEDADARRAFLRMLRSAGSCWWSGEFGARSHRPGVVPRPNRLGASGRDLQAYARARRGAHPQRPVGGPRGLRTLPPDRGDRRPAWRADLLAGRDGAATHRCRRSARGGQPGHN